MRRFSSYGPIDRESNYYAPRAALIDRAFSALTGENPDKGGDYITVWAPRQCGKSWIMLEVLIRLERLNKFAVVNIDLEHLKSVTDMSRVIASITEDISLQLNITLPKVRTVEAFQEIFTREILAKPLVLILDEFDALSENIINNIVSIFRNIYMRSKKELRKPEQNRRYMLHSVALIGVRSVLCIENQKGSPFNVQQSLHIPNLTHDEVKTLFKEYETESGQKVDADVTDRLFYETRGQPGLTCWFGELLTQGFDNYLPDRSRPITKKEFETVFQAAVSILPNNNILNIISKAKIEPEKSLLLELFQTREKIQFTFDEPAINSAYMNGIIDKEPTDDGRWYLRFASPLVQKRLFNFFSRNIFKQMGELVEPFSKTDQVITADHLDIKELMKLYQVYFETNRSWLFKDVPRRSDMRIYEAVFHFNLYAYIDKFLLSRNGRVFPEFPTGNGKIDLLIRHADKNYGVELKSFTDDAGYRDAVTQAARYGKQLNLKEIFLVTFVEFMDEQIKQTYQKDYIDEVLNVTVKPIFIRTGA